MHIELLRLLGSRKVESPLANAVVYVAKAPKSNKACIAIDKALMDIERGNDFPPPMHLRDAHYKDAKNTGLEKVIFIHMTRRTLNSSLCLTNLPVRSI